MGCVKNFVLRAVVETGKKMGNSDGSISSLILCLFSSSLPPTIKFTFIAVLLSKSMDKKFTRHGEDLDGNCEIRSKCSRKMPKFKVVFTTEVHVVFSFILNP